MTSRKPHPSGSRRARHLLAASRLDDDLEAGLDPDDFPEAPPPPGLHATYVPGAAGGHLFLWGSGADHPRRCRAALEAWGFRAGAGLEPSAEVLLLPVAGSGAGPRLDGFDGPVEPFRMEGLDMSLRDAARGLRPRSRRRVRAAAGEGPGDSLECWSLATALSLELVARGRIVPRWRPLSRGSSEGPPLVEAVWTVSAGLAGDRRRLDALARALPPAARAVPMEEAGTATDAGEPAGLPALRPWSASALLRRYVDDLADEVARSAATDLDLVTLSQRSIPGQAWQWTWLGSLFRGREAALFGPPKGEATLQDVLERWVAPLLADEGDGARACAVLLADAGGDAGGGWKLALALQALDDPAFLVSAERVLASGMGAVEEGGRIFRDARARLERGARVAAAAHPLFRRFTERLDETLALDDEAVGELLTRAAPLLRSAGLGVALPEGFGDGIRPHARLRVDLVEPASGSARGDGDPRAGASDFALDSLLRFHWEVALGEEVMAVEEFRRLVKGRRSVVRRREGWVVLGPDAVREVERAVSAPPPHGLGGAGMLGASLAGSMPFGNRDVPVVAAPDVERLLEELACDIPAAGEATAPEGFAGTLRPYQARGLRWLETLDRHGLGGILADEMGLGKTVQLIALVLRQRDESGLGEASDGQPSLVVCPASVLGNWAREMERFAPAVPVLRHHGPARARSVEELTEATGAGLALTTYGTLRRDVELLAAVPWLLVALDEAQNVKNPDSAQARAARALRARQRVALTGTPVENRLDELWSISEFVNPGLLGTRRSFRTRIALPIEEEGSEDALRALRRLTAPFALRRLKSQVATELPEKTEMPVFCTLTPEQAALYQAVVDESLASVTEASGIERRGRVLALLTRLKQVVNHPAHYLGEAEPLDGRSGKLARLGEMLAEVAADGERALVFTQYRRMGELLVTHLARRFGWDVPFLHGGVPASDRDRLVRDFQDGDATAPAFVLSLRAGGTGLNLTRANHVFHYDRWWNPAVEDQATDRAHRIGQSREVLVHKFVTLGTLEERIDAMLERKRALVKAAVATGEAWITELPDEELRALVALDADAVVDDDPSGDGDIEDPSAGGDPGERDPTGDAEVAGAPAGGAPPSDGAEDA